MNEENKKEVNNKEANTQPIETEKDFENLTDDEKIEIVARRILEKHRRAFEELAK